MKGLSFSQIAAELCKLGRKVSRNAVIGKAKRLKLPSRAPSGGKAKSSEHREKLSQSARRFRKDGAWMPAVEVKPTPSIAGPFLGINLIELGPDSCRFPLGEGAAVTFCGQPARLDSSYCEYHHKVCVIVRTVQRA